MKINNFGTSGVNPYKNQMNKIAQIDKTFKNASDKVEISATAKEMQQISQFTEARQAKVKELKNQVENGNYQINPMEIAQSITNYYTDK